MDFQKKYPILQLPNEHLIVRWTRGYRNVEVFHNDRLVTQIAGIKQLRNGVKMNDSRLGTIEMKLSEKPIAIDIIVAGYHSPINVTYPTKELKSASTIFWALAVISVLGALYEGMSATMWYGPIIGGIIIFIDAISIIIYALTGFLIQKGKSWIFFLGLSWYSLFTLYYVTNLLISGFYFDTFFIAALRVVVTIVLGYYIKHASASLKHKKYENQTKNNKEILDDLS